MFKWLYWWKLSKKVKKSIQKQIELVKSMPPADPPTPEQVEAFKKEMGEWVYTGHCMSQVTKCRAYYIDGDIKKC